MTTKEEDFYEEPLPQDSSPAADTFYSSPWCVDSGGTFWGQWQRNLSSSEDGEELAPPGPHLSSLLETFRHMVCHKQPMSESNTAAVDDDENNSPRAEGISECRENDETPQWHRPWSPNGMTLFELVLESEDLVSDLRVEDDELLTFLSEPSNMVRLAELVVTESKTEGGDDSLDLDYVRQVKLPYVAQEIICSGGPGLCRALLQCPEVVSALLKPLSGPPPLDDRVALRLSNVFGILVLKCPKEVSTALSRCPPTLAPDVACHELTTSLNPEDDPLLYKILRHVTSNAICEMFKCISSTTSLASIFPAADRLGFLLTEQLGGGLDRTENVYSIISTLLSTPSLADFEVFFNSLVSRESYYQLMRCLTSSQKDVAQISAEILSQILTKCEDLFSSDHFWSTHPSPPRSLTKQIAPPSPPLLPLADTTEVPLSVVDTGPVGLALPAEPAAWSDSGWTERRGGGWPEIWEDSTFAPVESQQEPRPSEATMRNVRAVVYQVCGPAVQDALLAVLLPQARAARRRHKKTDGECSTPRRCFQAPRLTDESDLDEELTALDPTMETQIPDDEDLEINLAAARAVSRMISPSGGARAKSEQVETRSEAPLRRCYSAELPLITPWDMLAFSAEEVREVKPPLHNSESTTGSGSTIPSVNEALSPEPSPPGLCPSPEEPVKVDLPQGSKPRVGQLCLSFVHLVSAILHLDSPRASQVAIRLGPPLVELFFLYKWNSLLHNAIKQILIFIIETSNVEEDSPLDILFKESRLLSLIVKIAKRHRRWRSETDVNIRRQKRQRHRIGNLPQTLQIAETLITRARSSPWLQEQLSRIAGWTKVVETEVRYVVGIMSVPLGGPAPGPSERQTTDESPNLYFSNHHFT